jgi:hypothetical protein
MTYDLRGKWMLAGGLWLSAAGLPVIAGERAAPSTPSCFPNRGIVTAADSVDDILLEDLDDSQEISEVDCRPQRVGAISRWHRRCKARAQQAYWGYPEEFQDAPLGAMVQQHASVCIANGQSARMVLRQFDFVPGTSQLKTRGRNQLAKIADWTRMNPAPVYVAPTADDPELNEARRRTVFRELAELGCPISYAQVVIGVPAGSGLSGNEGIMIQRNLNSQTASKGSLAGGGAGGAAGGGGASGAGNGNGAAGGSSNGTSGRSY